MLILYLATLLNAFISSNSHLHMMTIRLFISSLSICKPFLSWFCDFFLSFFLFFFFWFCDFFLCLLWLGFWMPYWIEVVRVSVLVAGELSGLHLWVLHWLWFVINSFHYIEICCLYTRFGKSFCHEWMLSFSNCFFWLLSFIDVVHHID